MAVSRPWTAIACSFAARTKLRTPNAVTSPAIPVFRLNTADVRFFTFVRMPPRTRSTWRIGWLAASRARMIKLTVSLLLISTPSGASF